MNTRPTNTLPGKDFYDITWWRSCTHLQVQMVHQHLLRRARGVYLALALLALLGLLLLAQWLDMVTLPVGTGAVIPVLAAACLALGICAAVTEARLEALQPVRGKIACEYLLRLVGEYEAVRAYRDQVVANGREILEADKACMQMLAGEAARAADEVREQEYRRQLNDRAVTQLTGTAAS